jgi:NAD(P)-dependent dehydrogenase (short-subunit alcohol dehydrogenase family)
MTTKFKRSITTGAVLITGTDTGIGEACALYLDGLGFMVFAGVLSASHGEDLKQKASVRFTPIVLDVTDPTSISSAAETVAVALGEAGLIGLVNNAGIAVAGPLEFLPIADIRQQLEVNVIGLLAVTQAFLPFLRRGHGRIVNIGSVSGRIALPLLGPYAASKYAVEAISDSLRGELASWNIGVALIEPGAVATPIWDKGLEQEKAMRSKLSAQALALYGPMLKVIGSISQNSKQGGMPVSKIAEVVEHALTAQRPKIRYLVGKDAYLLACLGLVPSRWRDRLAKLLLGRV